jgi:glycosyltransferase involved in cell wall biosynthesis
VVDNDYFAHAADARATHRHDLRTKMCIDPDACVFLFAGKLEEKKRPADLLRAAASLPSELKKKINLLFAGDGPLRASLEAEARASRVSVRFAGFMNQSQLPDAYAVSDVLVLPSDAGETWGLVVNEAMASGRPALVSNLVGCAADLIVAGETGRVHACGNVAELAQNMVPYLNDPSLASLQGERARHHISNFTYAVVIKGIYEAICSLRR